jgi:hypothetical protein
MRDYMTYLADQADLPVQFVPSDESRQSFASDNTRRTELLGPCRVAWRDGMQRAVEAHFPSASDKDRRPVVDVRQNIWGQR